LAIRAECSEALEAILSAIAVEEHRFEDNLGGDEEYSEDLAKYCEKIRHIIDSGLPRILAAATKDLA